MSISNLEMKWISFTENLRNVGVLLIFVMIPYLALVIIPIQFFFIRVALKDIDSINHELNDPYINSFRSRYLMASIIKLIGSMTIHVAGVIIVFILNTELIGGFGFLPWWIIPSTNISLIIGFVIMIIGSSVEVGAWNNLRLLIHHNKELFPETTHYETTANVKRLRSGALLWALGFLFITIIIGWIFQLKGYFGLSKIAKRGNIYKINTRITQKPQPVSVNDFCSMCGASVSKGASYCAECGVKIVN